MILFKKLLEWAKDDEHHYNEEIKDLDERLKNHYSTIKPEHNGSIREYTGVGSKYVNNHLWKNRSGIEHPYYPYMRNNKYSDKIPSMIKDLDSSISSHKTPESFTVYSGTPHDPREWMNSEGIMHHPAYLSTSLNKSIAQGFTEGRFEEKDKVDGLEHRHLLKIHVPKDHHGIYIGKIYHREKEFILPRGTNLKHLGTEKKQYDSGTLDYIHHMEIIP